MWHLLMCKRIGPSGRVRAFAANASTAATGTLQFILVIHATWARQALGTAHCYVRLVQGGYGGKVVERSASGRGPVRVLWRRIQRSQGQGKADAGVVHRGGSRSPRP